MSINSTKHSSFLNLYPSEENSPLDKLEKAYLELVEKSERYVGVGIEEIARFQDQLNQASPYLHEDPKYQQIVEGIEALLTSVFTADQYSQTSTALFKYDGEEYAVKPTSGVRGACLIHALSGEEIDGIFQFRGSDAKKHFTDTLKTALKVNRSVEKIFCEVILGHLAASDHSARMLAKPDIQKYVNNLELFYSNQIKNIQAQEVKERISMLSQKTQLLDKLNKDKQDFILSDKVVNHYITTVNDPAFYLNTHEAKLAAHLFAKNVLIVASREEGIEPVELISASPSTDELVVIHHYGSHFSRCVKIDPPPNFASSKTSPFFAFSRETRPSMLSTMMTWEEFNPETYKPEITLVPGEGSENINSDVANAIAAFGHCALAIKAIRDKEHPFVLHWTQHALEKTASQIRLETGKKLEAASYEEHADKVKQKIAEKKQDYQEMITEMEQLLTYPGNENVKKFFAKRKEATELRPTGFKVHNPSLLLALLCAHIAPDISDSLICDAYKCSPLLTFNTLAQLLMRESQERFQAFSRLFFKYFPHDLVGHLIANTIQESEEAKQKIDLSRKAFSILLGDALNAVQKGQWETAREKFSDAEFYHISDKRPYIYKALIDMMQGETTSAIHLIAASQNLVDWFNHASDTSKTDRGLETQILKKILALFRSPKNTGLLKPLIASMKAYLSQHSNADLIWAKMVIDLTQNLVENVSNDWLELLEMYISSTFNRLINLNLDLSEFEGYMMIQDNEVVGRPSITLTWPPESNPLKIVIDPLSFQMPEQIIPRLLKQILWKSYNAYFLLTIRKGANLEGIFAIKISETDTLLYTPFIQALLERMERERNPEQRYGFLQWTLAHLQIWPPAYRQPLTDCILRWQVERPAPHKSHQKHKALEEKILSGTSSSWLHPAKRVWDFLRAKKYADAQEKITRFFNHWQRNLSDGVDPIALNALCAARVLLKNQKLLEAMPATAKSAYHSSLIWSALSILAREGVESVYVVPDTELSQQDIKILCRLYTGRKREEGDQDYAKRLEAMQVPNIADLRQLKYFPSSKWEWTIPFARTALTEQIRKHVQQEKIFYEEICAHNRKIALEEKKPDYTQNPEFIRWVKKNPKCISNYLENEEKTRSAINQAFPHLPEKVKNRFFDELNQKAVHLSDFREQKKVTPKPSVRPERRFWQLVEQTAELIGRVSSGRRSAVGYNIIVRTQSEARFVMELLYEWSRNAWTKEINSGFIKYFHGPETHIWRDAPRIPHFNAGAFFVGEQGESLENVHIYFEQSTQLNID